MSFREAYLKEFDHEAVSTRKMLERIPEEKFDWAPHEKSMKLKSLANHIVGFPGLVAVVFQFDEFDTKSPEAIAARPPACGTTAELLDRWDRNLEQMRVVVANAPEEQFRTMFTLKAGQQTIFTMARKVALRSFVLNHMIHHRGQLSVYLRLLDVPIPSIYGPSADEK